MASNPLNIPQLLADLEPAVEQAGYCSRKERDRHGCEHACRELRGAQFTRALAGGDAAREVEVDCARYHFEQQSRQRRSGERDGAALEQRKARQPSGRVADQPQHRQFAPLALGVRPQARGERNQIAGRAQRGNDGENDRQIAAERQRTLDLALARRDRDAAPCAGRRRAARHRGWSSRRGGTADTPAALERRGRRSSRGPERRSRRGNPAPPAATAG